VPPVLMAIAGLQVLAAVGYGLGLTPSSSVAVAIILLLCAVVTALLAGLVHVGVRRKRSQVAGLALVSAATALSGAVVLVAYVGDMGITVALPYCVLVAVGGAPFWPQARHFVLGMAGIFLPLIILLLVTSPSAVEWSFSFQLSAVTLATSFGLYHLMGKTSKRAHVLGMELEQRATFDGLTGVLNRAAWIERAEASLRADQRRGMSTACLFLDMDHFKQINDDAGHDAGDAALGFMSDILKRCASERHLVGRFGGDEFVMLLPGAGPAEADAMAAQIRQELHGHDCGGHAISASIGIASSRRDEMLGDLLRRADMAMLEEKARGRDIPPTAREDLPTRTPVPVPA